MTNIIKNSNLPVLNHSFVVFDFDYKQVETVRIIPIDTPFIDSFSLKIKMSEIEVIDPRLTSMTSIYYESLDAIDCELNPPKPVIFENHGIKVRFSLAQIPDTCPVTKKKISVEYCVITVSSKLLKENYFDGINNSNIYRLYTELLQFDVFYCSFYSFINGKVSDIDIAINRRISLPDFSGVCKSLLTQADERAKHARFFNDETQTGLMFNNRNWAKPSLPFIKLYQKELELKNRSLSFYTEYLQAFSEQIQDLTRVEATIKNYAHRKRLENNKILPNFTTLEELLNIPQANLFEFVCFSLNSYIQWKPRFKSPKLSPQDFLIFQLMQNCESYGLETLLEIADLFEGSTPEATKVAKSRIRRKIEELFYLIGNAEKIEELKTLHNAEIAKYLEFFQVFYKPQKAE